MDLLLPDPHQKQAEFISSAKRWRVLNWGRRTGKSVAVWEDVVLKGMMVQGTYYIVCPTYKQAKSIYWRDIVKRYKAGFMTFNEQELSITFDHLSGIEIPAVDDQGNETIIKVNHDPNLPPTRIELKGADNPESLRGVSLSGCVLDEYAFMPEGKYVFDVIIRPALSDRNGWATFVSTPNGVYNHFYEMWTYANEHKDEYFSSHATSLDNPYFSKKEFEEVKVQYEREGKMDAFNQEYMAQFSNPTSLVYGKFDRGVHVFGPGREVEYMPQKGTYCLTIDFGMTDPTAAIFVLMDQTGTWWIYDEIYQSDLDLDKLVYVLRDKMGEEYFTRILGDGAARFEIESLKKRRFRITGAKKGADSLRNGIKEVQQLLEIRESTGKPKLYIASHCKNTIEEFERYSWERDAFNEITNIPEDKNNHAMDAIRYLALDKANPVQRTKRKRYWDPDTGRALN